MASLVLLAGCQDEPTVPRLDPNAPKTLADSVFGAGNVEWYTPDASGALTMQPSLDEKRVFMQRERLLNSAGGVARDQELIALDRVTGVIQWHTPLVGSQNTASAGDIIGAVQGSLPLFNRWTGAQANHFVYDGPLSTNVASDGTTLFVGSKDGHAMGVNPATGSVMWDIPLAGDSPKTATGVASSGNSVAFTLAYKGPTDLSGDSGIVAVVLRGGSLRWRAAVPARHIWASIYAAPVIMGGLVVVVTAGHEVFAFDLASGALSWYADVRYGDITYNRALATCDGRIIVGTGDQGLASLSAIDGSEQWHVAAIGDGVDGVQCSYGTVLVGRGGLTVLDAATGAQVARYPLIVPEPDENRPLWFPSVVRDETHFYVGMSHGFAKVKAP